MAGKVCPLLSAGGGPLRDCIGNDCMMFSETASSGACTFIKSPHAIATRMDTLTAQLAEMQVAIVTLSKA